jgi:hypothetical protein
VGDGLPVLALALAVEDERAIEAAGAQPAFDNRSRVSLES